jgi:similar to stage IV sporulation protein
MPLETSVKSYTGETEKKTALIIAGKRINLYFNAGIYFPNYDKMTTAKYLTLPGGFVLPIAIVRDEYTEYDTVGIKLTVLEAETLLQQRLLDRLALASDGEVVKTDFETVLKDGVITVTLTAECLEQIGRERPFTPEELTEAALPEPEE